MSIVSEALKKAQQRKRTISLREREEVLTKDLSPQIKELTIKKKRWSILSALGTLFIVGLLVLAFLVFLAFVYNTESMPILTSFVFFKNAQSISAPLQTEEEELPSFILTGIIKGKGEPLAVINGSIRKKGDFIGGAQVRDIRSDRVTLLYRNREITLRID